MVFFTLGCMDIPQELEMLARAGYSFREGFTEKIRYEKIDKGLPFPHPCLYEDGTYVVGPEEGKELLVTRDLSNYLETLDISQTETPGVLQIVTQHLSLPHNKNNAGYLIHMHSETMPQIDWREFDLKTYNLLSREYR